MATVSRPDSSGTDPALRALAPSSGRQGWAWWIAAALLGLATVLLFLPWSSDATTPTVDLRSELIWSSLATILVGIVGLLFPSRWMAYVATLPTIGALTDIGPVFWPSSGTYSWPVKAVVLVLSAIGITWFTSSFLYPAREQSTRWVVAPVASALMVATLWLPWVVVSEIGAASGSQTAIQLIFGDDAVGARGVGIARVAILFIMLVGIVGAILPLANRTASATKAAMLMSLAAAVAIVVLCLWLALGDDAVQTPALATGQRIALLGFMLITLVWNARLKSWHLAPEGDDDSMEHSGIIPIIMTGDREPRAKYRTRS